MVSAERVSLLCYRCKETCRGRKMGLLANQCVAVCVCVSVKRTRLAFVLVTKFLPCPFLMASLIGGQTNEQTSLPLGN